MKSARISTGWVLLVILLAFLALLNAAPSLQQIPATDSSIFQYIGERITEGALPYRDVYDHKPPLIFYLDAFGLALGGRWGIWAIELLSLCAAGLAGLALLRRSFGALPAGLGVAAMLLNLVFVHDGGNLTEEFALPLQFGAFLLLAQMEARKKTGWRPIAIGLLLGLASSLKQPLAGPGIAIGVYLLAERLGRRNWHGLLDLLWIGLGAASVWAAWAGWFALNGSLAELWDAAFAHNFRRHPNLYPRAPRRARLGRQPAFRRVAVLPARFPGLARQPAVLAPARGAPDAGADQPLGRAGPRADRAAGGR